MTGVKRLQVILCHQNKTKQKHLIFDLLETINQSSPVQLPVAHSKYMPSIFILIRFTVVYLVAL